MGWAPSTAFSHAARLIAAGLAESCRLRQGDGSLIYATRSGVEVSGAFAPALPGEPAPTTWAHLEACAWTAAWLTARGRHVIGKTSAAIYVCGPSELAERVRREAAEFGLTGERKTLRVELLATVIAAARATRLGAEPRRATLVSGGVA